MTPFLFRTERHGYPSLPGGNARPALLLPPAPDLSLPLRGATYFDTHRARRDHFLTFRSTRRDRFDTHELHGATIVFAGLSQGLS